MAMVMQLHIVSAESEIFTGVAEMLIAPGAEGDLGIMPQHTQLVAMLKPGEVRVTEEGGKEETFYVSGGMLEVQPHVVTILSDTALRAKDLDEAAAKEAKARAEEALKEAKGEIDYARAQAELTEATAQLHMLNRLRQKRGG